MSCEKKDCKHYDRISKTFCGRLGEGNCDKYVKERKARKLKTIAIPYDNEKMLYISKKHYGAFMKFKTIVIEKSYVEKNALVLDYRSVKGGVAGKIKFKDLGEN